MKRHASYFIIMVVLAAAVGLSSCGGLGITPVPENNDSASDTVLKFEKVLYKKWNRDIEISYPQISSPATRANKLTNRIIEHDALSILELNSTTTKDLSIEINCEYNIIRDRIISVRFYGFAYLNGNAYPNNVFYSSNIDIERGERLTGDSLFDLNRDLIQNIKDNAKYIRVPGEYVNDELALEVNQALKDYDSTKMLEDMKLSGVTWDRERVYVYIKDGIIGISLPVLHALGDYANFELEHESLLK